VDELALADLAVEDEVPVDTGRALRDAPGDEGQEYEADADRGEKGNALIASLIARRSLDVHQKFISLATKSKYFTNALTDSFPVNIPPAKAGGFGLRLKAGSVGHPVNHTA
jgi:hypothetical protein